MERSITWLYDKKNVLEIADRIIAEFDAINPELRSALDFLQYRVKHKNAQDKVREAIDYGCRFRSEFGNLRIT